MEKLWRSSPTATLSKIKFNMNTIDEIKILEQELQQAMLDSNVEELDELILDDLIFTNHMGVVLTKKSDLDAHRTRTLTIASLQASEQTIRPFGDTIVVSVLMHISGKYDGHSFEGANRYTRVWVKYGASWKIAVAHASIYQP
ncbi:MAG: hypothetical protein JWQ28_155 [Pedobacter sp.]|nr:hypothetical protein [Pedobacter sp.]